MEVTAGAKAMKVLLVDNHPVARAGIAHAIKAGGNGHAPIEASCPEDALRAARRHKPDVIVLDIRLGPGQDGLELLPELKRAAPAAGIIVLSLLDDPATVRRAYALGVDGYVLKDSPLDELLDAIARAAERLKTWDSRLIGVLSSEPSAPSDSRGQLQHLTHQEQRILERVARGMTNPQIGKDLRLSDKTIRNYVSRIMDKSGVRRRAELAALYVRTFGDRGV